MKVLFDIIHPAHVHFFKNAMVQLQEMGHTIAVTGREKDVTIELLDNLQIPFTKLSRVGQGRPGLLKELIVRDWRLLRFCRTFKPDVLTGISGMFAAHVGKLIGKPSVVWDDTEHQHLAHKITWPVASCIQSPDCYLNPPAKRQVLYPGCHELAYLHPKRFTPDRTIVKSLGIDPDQPYCILRFVSWGAHHDVGQHGLDDQRKLEFVQAIEKVARPLITSEGELPEAFQPYQLKMPVHYLHHVLAYARLCVAEGATVASESAMLGVPAVYINTLRLGYIDMLERHGLLKQTVDTDEALRMSLDWLNDPQAIEAAVAARDTMLQSKIDVTDYIVETLLSHAARGRA